MCAKLGEVPSAGLDSAKDAPPLISDVEAVEKP